MIRKISDEKNLWKKPFLCRHPEHNFPNMIVLPDGIYEHTCPGCGKIHVVTINNPTMFA